MQNAILLTVGVAGMIAIGAVPLKIPGILRKPSNARFRYRAKTVLGTLKKKGLVDFVEVNGNTCARLTKQGEQIFLLMKEKTRLTESRPKKWDKRYRLVMFDVPEKRKRTREVLRRHMREVGFLRVQDSAWLYPYDCEDFVALLKADLHIGKDVLYAVIEEIEHDLWIRKHFDLPLS